MTAPINTLHNDSPATADGRTATIIPFHVAADPGSAEPDLAGLAVARLEAFLEEEGPGLSRLFSLLDLTGAEVEVDALHALLREAGDSRQALASAEMRLDRIVGDLAEISPRAEIQRPMRAGEASAVRHLDAMVRWLGARSEEMLRLVRRGLD